MIIIDSNTGKEQNVKNIEIIYYKMSNEEGIEQDMKCVEYIVIGNNTTWKNWSLYKDFKKFNPTFKEVK